MLLDELADIEDSERERVRRMLECRGEHNYFAQQEKSLLAGECYVLTGVSFDSQVLWMRRLRVLRRLLVKYRTSGKIDKHLYHELYHLSKGNTFKHKRALVEHVRQIYTLSPNTHAYQSLLDSQGQGREAT
jgi:ribosomal protein L19E